MHRRNPNARLQIMTEAIQRLIPGATPTNLSVTVTETLPDTVGHDGQPGTHTWTGSPESVARAAYTALWGRPRPAVETLSPLAQAEAAKRSRDLVEEIGALQRGHRSLTEAAWYPARPGDLVHVHYPRAERIPEFGETYIVGDAGDGLMSLQLLAHTCPAIRGELQGFVGCFAAEAADDPLYEMWFEAGPGMLTVVRDGRPVHIGGAA